MAMIRSLGESDFETLCAVINDGATAYKGVVPVDRLNEPYLSSHELHHEIEAGVVFWGHDVDGEIGGVMGIQEVGEVTLIRHAYVRTNMQGRGIGGQLLEHLGKLTGRPALMGTWAAAVWAIGFYEKHGFRLVSRQEKDRLLRKYWSIPEQQVDTSVVLADERAFDLGIVAR